MGRWVFPVCKWKFYPQMCIPTCFSALWCWISDTTRQTCFGCQETILSLLKTTFSFPRGRQHSPQCSDAVGGLVLPLLPSPHSDLPLWLMPLLPDFSCPLNPFSAYFAVSLSFHQQECSPAPLAKWERRTHPSMLEEPPSPAVLYPSLLPLPFVPIYPPMNHSQIFFALYKSWKFCDIFLHPGCRCCCSQESKKYPWHLCTATNSFLDKSLVTPCQANCCLVWVIESHFRL